ncbi:MAG: hypothetical protein WC917_03755 [Bacilli bacterium]|jgi:hypothetical protein
MVTTTKPPIYRVAIVNEDGSLMMGKPLFDYLTEINYQIPIVEKTPGLNLPIKPIKPNWYTATNEEKMAYSLAMMAYDVGFRNARDLYYEGLRKM